MVGLSQWRAAGILPAARLVLTLLLVFLAAGCAPGGGEVTLRVADGSDALAGLDRVVVTLHEAGVQPLGKPRLEGWIALPLSAPTVDLGAAGAAGTVVARGMATAGPFGRARVEVQEVYGELGGQRVPIRNIVEPIYLTPPLNGGPAEITIDLIVMPLLSPDAPERYAVFTKAVTVKAGGRTP